MRKSTKILLNGNDEKNKQKKYEKVPAGDTEIKSVDENDSENETDEDETEHFKTSKYKDDDDGLHPPSSFNIVQNDFVTLPYPLNITLKEIRESIVINAKETKKTTTMKITISMKTKTKTKMKTKTKTKKSTLKARSITTAPTTVVSTMMRMMIMTKTMTMMNHVLIIVRQTTMMTKTTMATTTMMMTVMQTTMTRKLAYAHQTRASSIHALHSSCRDRFQKNPSNSQFFHYASVNHDST